MRLVADANVFVSAALGRSPQAPSVRIINAALDGRVELVMSPALLAEIADVLARPRIRKRISAEDAQLFLGDLVAQAVMFADPANPPSVCCDPDDDCLVALTLTASADVLVSDGPDLVFGRTATEVFYASTIRARANKAWKAAGLEPITPHEARHCAISYFIAAGLDWTEISTWAGHGDVRQTWNRYGHLVPAGEEQARQRLDAFLTPTNSWRRLWRTTTRTTKPPKTRGF